MHGVKRVPESKEDVEAKKLKERSKLKDYLALTEEVLARKKGKDWSIDALELTSKLLRLNPEFYTIWNYRRTILLNGIFPERSPNEINDMLSSDLSMTTGALKAHPKIYWIWNHRRWCLENVPLGPGIEDADDSNGWRKTSWDRELFVVEKMLDADARNFLAWDYRRYVLASMPVPRPDTSELAYTMHKIEASFSNFSAWHQRSKIYSKLWENGTLDPVKSKEEEFELVRNAMYTDPNDQSAWMYHRWLIGSGYDRRILEREIDVIKELLDEEPDSKWCMESLVHYKSLLLRDHSGDSTVLVKECKDLLQQLSDIDNARRVRYNDIVRNLTSWL